MRQRYPKKRDAYYGTGHWQQLRTAVLQRDHYWCVRCRKRPANTVHHIVPRTKAPEKSNQMDNLESLCVQCHAQMHPEKGAKNFRGERKKIPVDIRVEVL